MHFDNTINDNILMLPILNVIEINPLHFLLQTLNYVGHIIKLVLDAYS